MKRALAMWLVLAATTILSNAAGLIIVHDEDFWRRPPEWWPQPPPHPIPPPRPVPPRHFIPPQPTWAVLEVAFTKADVKIQDQIATTVVEQEFYNPNPRRLEGTFLFPVPKGAHLNKFTMEINGKPVEAELLAADKARGIYEDIVRKLRDPALLEYADRGLFKVRIFPIEPHERKRITLSYSHLLKSDSGLLSYVLPLNTEKFSAKPLRTVSVKVSLESKRPLKSIYSSSHKVEVRRDGERKATVGFEATDLKPDADFQLFFTPEEGEFGLSLLPYRKAGEDGYFLLLVSPGAETKSGKVIPKDVIFVLDTSGSMAGAKLDQAKKALQFCVANLNDQDRFEVLRFATEVEPLFDRLADATKEQRDRADKFIRDLRPLGGTAIDEALRKALSLRPDRSDRPFVVIFLTDGRPTVGNTDENQIVDNATRKAKATTRIFCFGIGTDVNTHLLDRITEDTHACSQYVLPDEDLEVKVSSFFTRIKEPVLAEPKLTFPDGVRVTKAYPWPVPDLFKGEQLVLAGRYTGAGKGRIEIEGSVAGETRRFSYPVEFTERADEHDFIPRLWATRRVGYLLDEIRLRGENKELRDEVTELARRYGIVTPYTAYLIVEDEARRGVAANGRMNQLMFGADTDFQQLAGESYLGLSQDRSGAAAVAGARSYQALKDAQAPQDAITLGASEALRASPRLRALTSDRNIAGGTIGAAARVKAPADAKAEADSAAKQYAQQSRYVNGRTFYQDGSQWIDSGVQQQASARRVRVQFGSTEYFDLIKQHPETKAWLALGTQVQFVLASAVYEIFE